MKINEKIIAREIQGETVILNKENGDYFSLNLVGTDIYNNIIKGLETEDIISELLKKYKVDSDTLRIDIASLIFKLKEKRIILDK
ncbi:MAG: PqqD family protein [Candidatus Humimicrobiaceae bacterium]